MELFVDGKGQEGNPWSNRKIIAQNRQARPGFCDETPLFCFFFKGSYDHELTEASDGRIWLRKIQCIQQTSSFPRPTALVAKERALI